MPLIPVQDLYNDTQFVAVALFVVTPVQNVLKGGNIQFWNWLDIHDYYLLTLG